MDFRKMATEKYKPLIIVPVVLLLISVGILVSSYLQKGYFFERSFELEGGTSIQVGVSEDVDIERVDGELSAKFGDVKVREVRGFAGHSLMVQTGDPGDVEDILSELEGMGIDTGQSSVQTIGPALGASFWYQTQAALVIAFVFMGLIVFGIFRKVLPSFYVILAALSDILITLALMQVLGIELSLAGLAALLMIMGYSIDTDIMLTTRLLRTEKSLMDRMKSSLKTGLTMSGTTIGALIALVLSAISPLLTQIATVLLIGLAVDVVITWFQNATLLRWYIESRGV